MPNTLHTHTIVTPNNETREVSGAKKKSPFSRLFKRESSESHESSRSFFQKFSLPSLRRKNNDIPQLLAKKPNKNRKRLFIALGVFAFFILVFGSIAGVIGYRTYAVAMDLKTQALEAKAVGTTLKDQLKTQNLPAAEATLIDLQSRVETMQTTYEKLSFYQNVPIAKAYYADGNHGFVAAEAGIRAGLKSVDAVVPYADVLGFAGEGSFEGGTAEDRIRLVLETLGKVTPVLDDINAELAIVQSELDQIDPNRYPEKFQEFEVRSQLIQAQELVEGASVALTEFRPVLEVLPEVAGSQERKKYLVIFQNDNELRPTGGFMTAYAVLFVEDGKVTPEKSDDIYELDKKFNKRITIPPILGRYLTSEKYFNLRDMNVSPDFKESMDTFYEHYQEIPGEPQDIDGIISVDTNLLTELVRVLGPVDVPGYGTFSAENDPRCDCPQIIYVLSEIVDRPTPYIREDRKGIIAPMMQAILQKAYSAPKETWPALAELGWKKIEGKHVQFYMFDEEHQKAAELVNAAGRLNPIKENHDYLAVVDANLGGAKSNLFVQTEGEIVVSAPENGQITNAVTLKYKNPRKGDNCNLEAGLLCLNGTLRDWVRVYVPADAEVINTVGFDDGTFKESVEGEFKIIEGVIRVAPLGQANLKIEYTVPYSDPDTYRLQIRKQAGTDQWPYLIDVNGHQEEFILDKDKVIEIDF